MERLLQEQVFCQDLRPKGYLQWINLFLKDCTLWNGLFVQKFLQSYIPWKRPMSENFMCPVEKRSVWDRGRGRSDVYDLGEIPFLNGIEFANPSQKTVLLLKSYIFLNEKIIPSRMKAGEAGAVVTCTLDLHHHVLVFMYVAASAYHPVFVKICQHCFMRYWCIICNTYVQLGILEVSLIVYYDIQVIECTNHING